MMSLLSEISCVSFQRGTAGGVARGKEEGQTRERAVKALLCQTNSEKRART